jgi:hypothetical protein
MKMKKKNKQRRLKIGKKKKMDGPILSLKTLSKNIEHSA